MLRTCAGTDTVACNKTLHGCLRDSTQHCGLATSVERAHRVAMATLDLEASDGTPSASTPSASASTPQPPGPLSVCCSCVQGAEGALRRALSDAAAEGHAGAALRPTPPAGAPPTCQPRPPQHPPEDDLPNVDHVLARARRQRAAVDGDGDDDAADRLDPRDSGWGDD